MLKALSVMIAVVLVSAQPADAHHSFALFDATKTVTVEGTVKKFEWTNPHSWITLEVIGPKDTADEWMIELPASGVLAREGWNKNYVKVGEKLLLRINPLKNGGKGGTLESFNPDEPRQPAFSK